MEFISLYFDDQWRENLIPVGIGCREREARGLVSHGRPGAAASPEQLECNFNFLCRRGAEYWTSCSVQKTDVIGLGEGFVECNNARESRSSPSHRWVWLLGKYGIIRQDVFGNGDGVARSVTESRTVSLLTGK